MTCCLCGYDEGVSHCPLCGHNFCGTCRGLYFDRGLEALKEFITRKPPRHCRGHGEES